MINDHFQSDSFFPPQKNKYKVHQVKFSVLVSDIASTGFLVTWLYAGSVSLKNNRVLSSVQNHVFKYWSVKIMSLSIILKPVAKRFSFPPVNSWQLLAKKSGS